MQIQNGFQTSLQRVRNAAASITPAQVAEKGEFLGAGLAGGAYEVEIGGQAYVAKQLGHSSSVLGGLQTWSPGDKQLQAMKQVAVQNALGMAGFPLPATALLGSEWVLMDKVEGLALADLTAAEADEAQTLAWNLSQTMEPIASATLSEMLKQHPDKAEFFTCNMDIVGNTRFARTPEGLRVAGVFDPII